MRVLPYLVGVCVCLAPVPDLDAQSLPAAERAVAIAAKAIRQSSTTSPLEITLKSDEHIIVPAQDVHEKATLLLRQTATEQKGAIDPTLVVALHVRQRPTYKAFNREYARLALRSGSEIAVPLADLRDPKVAVLETLRYESS